MKGLWGQRARLSSRTFQQTRETVSNMHIVMCSVPLTYTIRTVFIQAVAVAIFLTFVHLSPMYLHKETFEVMETIMEQTQATVSTLKLSSGFVFSFYFLGRVGWWWSIVDCGRAIQGRTHDIAMLVSGVTANEEHTDQDAWWEAKWNFYRYLMLIFILSFRPLSPALQLLPDDKLEQMGLLRHQEALVIQKALHPRKVVLKWLTLWVSENVQDKTDRHLVHDKICGLRGATGTLHDTLELRAPLSFETVLYAMVWLWIILMPFSHISSTKRSVLLETPIELPLVNFMIVASFYLTSLKLLEVFKDPFGLHADALHVQAIYLETETTVVDYLTSPMSDALKPACQEVYYEEEVNEKK